MTLTQWEYRCRADIPRLCLTVHVQKRILAIWEYQSLYVWQDYVLLSMVILNT